MPEQIPFNTWLQDKLDNPERESYAGWHVIQTFMQNPYTYYLKYVRGLKPIYTKPALVKGGIIHSAIEAAYLYSDVEMRNTANALFKHRQPEYEDREQHTTDWKESLIMLDAWARQWLDSDKRDYHILHLEEMFELPLLNGYIITIRPDIIVQQKNTSEILGRDHKTTGWNATKAHQDLEDGDQSTSYIWGAAKLYPKNRIIGIESDVIFKRTNMKDAKALRPGIIQRSDWYISQWELSTIAWIQDIARRVRMIEDGYPPAFAFPRGESYWGPSDWKDVYRVPLPDDPNEPPYGYTIDEWQRDRARAMLDIDDTMEESNNG